MKERLTGAIILVAVLVLLVPELLSGPGPSAPSPPPASADEAQMRSYTINLTDDANERRPAAVPGTEAPASAVKPAEAAAKGTDAQTVERVGVGDASSAGSAPVEDAHASGPEQAGTSKPPAVTPPPAARAAPAPRAASTPAAPESGWAVQVGSFASRDNAKRLARELEGKGFAAIVTESSGKGRRLWRVRVGPEADRPAAAALDAKLRAAGYKGALVSYP